MGKGLIYSDSGVNNDAKEDVSKILFEASRKTWKNRKGRLGEVIVPFEDFSGIRYVNVAELPKDTVMVGGADGIGTKVKIAQMMGNHRTMAYDLVAMTAEDVEIRGAEPALVLSILDTNSLKGREAEARQIAEGLVNAAREANVAVLNGESAELGTLVGGYGDFNYNWGGVCIGFAKKDRLFTGKEIEPGDRLVGLVEKGFRANGISLLRKALERVNAERWHSVLWKNGIPLGEMALTPSRIYTKAILEMTGGYDSSPKTVVHGIAHITGGGLPEKLGRILRPSGLGAIIDSPCIPSEFMSYIQVLGNVSDREAYKTWNMGQGMVVITPAPNNVMGIARKYGIDSKVIGEVTKESGIRIKSAGSQIDDNGSYQPKGIDILTF